ncbi:ABC transporter permease [Ascidiaceihabitans sp.]|uniref:ABC transporter permease n=1 Tax=Ascidiaceihabitans sp. TaxID=1872644 RepID=UPI003296ECB2
MDITALFDLAVLDGAIRFAVPLLLACLAGLFSERAGVVDIGLEGKMLMAAFMSASAAYVTGNAWVGMLAGVAGAVALSLLHGLASITFRGNQLISGVAINFFGAGVTVVAAQSWFAQGGRTPQLSGAARFETLNWPGALTKIREINDAPLVMRIYSELISGHSIITYLAVLTVPATWWIMYRTRFGLRLRAVGENPAAVDTAGISVVRLRYSAVIICGILCGVAGAYLATSLQAGFTRDMTAGRGYIALAALIFAKWRPWHALGATVLFGYLQALSLRPDVVERIATIRVQGQLLDVLPYLLTILILAGLIGRAIPPRAAGEPYVKGQ